MSDKYKDALTDLVETIMEAQCGGEIDAGCDGEGPLARALVILGKFKTTKRATKEIYGDYE